MIRGRCGESRLVLRRSARERDGRSSTQQRNDYSICHNSLGADQRETGYITKFTARIAVNLSTIGRASNSEVTRNFVRFQHLRIAHPFGLPSVYPQSDTQMAAARPQAATL